MKKLIALTLSLAPLSTFAAQITDINGVTSTATNIGNTATTLLISAAVIWIIISVVRYLIAGADTAARKEGGMRILFGVIGLFVILSIWGLVNILRTSFDTQKNAPQQSDINNLIVTPPRVN